VQAFNPDCDENEPAGQSKQLVDPRVNWYDPDEQLLHIVAPGELA
jgi:hypothetical protein